MHLWLRNLTLVPFTIVVGVFASASPAAAHNSLMSSDPANGAILVQASRSHHVRLRRCSGPRRDVRRSRCARRCPNSARRACTRRQRHVGQRCPTHPARRGEHDPLAAGGRTWASGDHRHGVATFGQQHSVKVSAGRISEMWPGPGDRFAGRHITWAKVLRIVPRHRTGHDGTNRQHVRSPPRFSGVTQVVRRCRCRVPVAYLVYYIMS